MEDRFGRNRKDGTPEDREQDKLYRQDKLYKAIERDRRGLQKKFTAPLNTDNFLAQHVNPRMRSINPRVMNKAVNTNNFTNLDMLGRPDLSFRYSHIDPSKRGIETDRSLRGYPSLYGRPNRPDYFREDESIRGTWREVDDARRFNEMDEYGYLEGAPRQRTTFTEGYMDPRSFDEMYGGVYDDAIFRTVDPNTNQIEQFPIPGDSLPAPGMGMGPQTGRTPYGRDYANPIGRPPGYMIDQITDIFGVGDRRKERYIADTQGGYQGVGSLTPSNIGVDRGSTTMHPITTMLENPQVMRDYNYARDLQNQMDPDNFLTNRLAVGDQFNVDPFGDINMPYNRGGIASLMR